VPAAGVAVRFDDDLRPVPRLLEALRSQPDLGTVEMCGYPIALHPAACMPFASLILAEEPRRALSSSERYQSTNVHTPCSEG